MVVSDLIKRIVRDINYKEYLLDAISLRVNGFISKPVDADKLVDLIGELTETIHLKKQVEIEDAEGADRLFTTLMGSEVPPRKRYIQTHARAATLDV